jgi:hypothetical protein
MVVQPYALVIIQDVVSNPSPLFSATDEILLLIRHRQARRLGGLGDFHGLLMGLKQHRPLLARPSKPKGYEHSYFGGELRLSRPTCRRFGRKVRLRRPSFV